MSRLPFSRGKKNRDFKLVEDQRAPCPDCKGDGFRFREIRVGIGRYERRELVRFDCKWCGGLGHVDRAELLAKLLSR